MPGWPLPAMPYVGRRSTVVGMTTIDLTDDQTQQPDDVDVSRVEELVGRLLASFTGGVELLTIELGRRGGRPWPDPAMAGGRFRRCRTSGGAAPWSA